MQLIQPTCLSKFPENDEMREYYSVETKTSLVDGFI